MNVNLQKKLEPEFFLMINFSMENVHGILYLLSVAIHGHIMRMILPGIRVNASCPLQETYGAKLLTETCAF